MKIHAKQWRIMIFIRAYTAERSRPPTIKEIADGAGVTNVSYHLKILSDKKLIKCDFMTARGRALTQIGRDLLAKSIKD